MGRYLIIHSGDSRAGAAVEHSMQDSDTSQEEYDSNVPLPEPTEGDYQEAQAMDKVLEKWKQNMEERAKNPRIALMVFFFFLFLYGFVYLMCFDRGACGSMPSCIVR